MFDSICSTQPYVGIRPNSTIWETLTPCFSFVVLPAVSDVFLAPLCLLILFLAGRLGERSAAGRLECNRISILKFVIAGLHAVVAVGHCVYAFIIAENRQLLLENGTNAICSVVFSLSVLAAYGLCVHDGVASSGWLHFTWFVRFLLLLPGFMSLIGGGQVHRIFMEKEPFLCLLIVHTLYFCATSIMVGVLCAPDRHSTRYAPLDAPQKDICPENTSSAVSVLFMWYANPLIMKGLRRTDLTLDDLWALDTCNRAGHVLGRYARTAGRCAGTAPHTVWSLFRRLVSVTRADIFASIVIVVALSFMRFGNAIFLKLIVDGVKAGLPLWYTVTILVLMVFFDLTLNLFYAKRDFVSSKSYMNVRTILITELSNKIMRLSPAAKTRFSCGEVMNVVSTDVNRIRMFWFQLRDFVYCPLLLILAFAGTFYVMGWNSCYGIVVLCVIIGFNYYVSARMAHYEHLQMELKDRRLKLINDVLSGIRALKLYAWEPSMQEMVAEIRAKEMAALRIVFVLDGLTTVSFQFGPIMAIFLSFYGHVVLDGNTLTPEVAFMSIMFFMMLRYAIYQLPQILTNGVKALISGRRIVRLLNEQEQQHSYVERSDPPPAAVDQAAVHRPIVVDFDNCSFSWDNSPASDVISPTRHLRDINLRVRKGELIGVVGRVGAGKSSLLSAIVGEIDCVHRDTAAVYAKSIGYVPQQAWIQNKTLKGNILLESPFKEAHYRRTIEACALLDDLKLLKAGDLTEIGEKGINLSGGQKARVSLARAVYQQADLYVLDDVLSAVDSHVGTHIFEKVVGPNGLLRDTTRIFALNSLAFLKDCDRIVVMDDGAIDDVDTFVRLVEKNQGPFADLMREYIDKQSKKQETVYLDGEPEPSDDTLVEEVVQSVEFDGQPSFASSIDSLAGGMRQSNMPTTTNIVRHRLMSHVSASSQRHRSESVVSSSVTAVSGGGDLPPGMTVGSPPSTVEMGRLMETEKHAKGIVARQVYLTYARVFGVWMCVGFFVTLFGGSLFESFANVWLARWSSNSAAAGNGTELSPTASLLVFGFFGFSNSIFIAFSTIFLAIGAYYASISFHNKLIHSLLRSPIAFFDRTPLGRIINRLSTDIDRIDENVPWSISFAFILLADAFNSIVAIVMVIPWLIVVVIPLFLSFMFTTYNFNKASVQFRRISSTSWSKCVSLAQDLYIGADSIRVYDVVRAFAEKINVIIDLNGEGTYIEFVANRWIQIQMDILTQIAIFLFVLMAVLLGSWQMITIGAVALVVSSSISFSGFLGEISRNWREVEVQMVGVERVQEYIDNEHEAPWRVPVARAPSRPWPVAGRVTFDHFFFRYRSDCDFVLNDLCLDIAGGTKVGIVGRTGAGKSSITMALFRVVEPASGTIRIDDVDVTRLGLHDLREVITIIPQDPVLFCGTLRSNIDPFESYEDSAIHDALEKANLKDFVESVEHGLEHDISEGGSNLSLGQRQLVCLARALLRQTTRILVLDEATAAVDPETDRLIQLSIRQYFRHCTVLTIAHRLNTILDYDRILVMNAGRAAEFDTPRALLDRPDSLFTQLVRHAGMSRESAIEAIRDNNALLLASDNTQKAARSEHDSSMSAQLDMKTPPHIDPSLIRAQVAAADGLPPPSPAAADVDEATSTADTSPATTASTQRLSEKGGDSRSN